MNEEALAEFYDVLLNKPDTFDVKGVRDALSE